MVPSPFHIAGYEIQPSASLVIGPGGHYRLEPKVMSVLELLAERAGQVVAKKEFMSRVWPETYVGDDALVRCISRLRRVLGDTGRRRRIIETVPKKGYRLIPAVNRPRTPPVTADLALESVLGTCTDQIYVFDREARYVFVSRAGARAVGSTPEEMIGKTSFELGMPARITRPFERDVASVFETRGFVRDTVRHPGLFGPREFEYVVDPICAGGEVVAALAVIRDVTGDWFKPRSRDSLAPRSASRIVE